MASACSRVRTPPLALTPSAAPTVLRMSAISSVVAPPVENPVEVFTNAAPAAFAARQALTFSSSLSRQVSMMTLTMAGAAASTTAAISVCTAAQSPDFAAPMFMTISTSSAPSRTARAASSAFAPLAIAPRGKPTTTQVLTPLPRSSPATSEA
ncbi:hypothetical protein SDC9_85358 [bioreactor metagenome]|uniref:Uncharacterized protein n=1 Tax=bioreactor metagenome TaxID=1076179 RepID=A0A644ZEL5_9ZZZZ